MPFLKEARERGAKLVVIDPRATTLARQSRPVPADRDRAPISSSRSRSIAISSRTATPTRVPRRHTRPAPTGCARRRPPWTFERAAEVSGVPARHDRAIRRAVCTSSPALVKCGWGLERNRNGGSAAAAVLALPAVAGKFGVRGGGYSMSNSASWNIERTWLRDPEPPTRAINMNHLGRVLSGEGLADGPPIKVLFVYNCNPAVTLPDQARVLKGLEREDLFTVVFDQVLTDTALYADVVLPATTFLEHYDFVQVVRPDHAAAGQARHRAGRRVAIERRGVRRADPARSDSSATAIPPASSKRCCRCCDGLPAPHGDELREDSKAKAPFDGRPVQFVDVMPRTADQQGASVSRGARSRGAAWDCMDFSRIRRPSSYPLALISPASERTVSSTLGELPRPTVDAGHAPRRCRRARDRGRRGRADVQRLRARCGCRCESRRWCGAAPWRCQRACGGDTSANGFTSNALVPDSLTDLGGGACFNDARVQIEKVAM